MTAVSGTGPVFKDSRWGWSKLSDYGSRLWKADSQTGLSLCHWPVPEEHAECDDCDLYYDWLKATRVSRLHLSFVQPFTFQADLKTIE